MNESPVCTTGLFLLFSRIKIELNIDKTTFCLVDLLL